MKPLSAGATLLWLVAMSVASPVPVAAVHEPGEGPATAPAAWHSGVAHAPQQPRSGEVVTVTLRAAAEVASATVEYQLLEPGRYVELKDPEYAAGWASVAMRRAADAPGAGGGATFVAELPASLQKHRRLVRYRVVAQGTGGARLDAPDPNSPTPNSAYFVYDGIPGWSAAVQPKNKGGDAARAAALAFPPGVMGSVQAYHLIAKKQSVENATWNERAGGSAYKYTGALVVGGTVYDHVRFRARGGVWRYALGKNMWKFDLPDGASFRPTDDAGLPYPGKWGQVNLRPCIQLGDYGRRGEQGLYESVGFRMFNLAGVAAPRTHYVQLRIVDEPEEAPAHDQYSGDFWGLYLAIEDPDKRFIKSHGLPDGNLYKMEGGTGELEHQAKDQPADKSDLNAFLGAYNGGDKPEDWWRANLELDRYYSYRAVLECIHHYDVGDGKNYYYHRDAQTGRWRVIPWDLDLTWADHMYGNGNEPFASRVLAKPAFKVEYQNRLREVRDLLFNPEQAGRLIDAYAAAIAGPAGSSSPTFVEADRRKWDYHPALAIGGQAGHGRFYQGVPTKDFAGMVAQMKDYVRSRGKWVDDTLLNDPKVPKTPTATYIGPPGFDAAQLRFRASPYEGEAPFAAYRWRLAEVAPPADATKPRTPPVAAPYEITPIWESAELPSSGAEVTLPPTVAQPGRTYRVRVRTKDATGRRGHWSPAVEFVAGGGAAPTSS